MGKALVGHLWLDVTNVMASKCSKKEKKFNFRLPSIAHKSLVKENLHNHKKGGHREVVVDKRFNCIKTVTYIEELGARMCNS